MGQPFVGPSGKFLRAILRQCGIDPNHTYMTNVFNLRPEGNKIERLCVTTRSDDPTIPGFPPLIKGKKVSAEYTGELERLHKEILREQPNLIIALGNTALWAVCKETGINKFRGTPLQSFLGPKVIPVLHPSSILRNYSDYPIFVSDISKARRESEFPEIRRPQRILWLEPELDDILQFEKEHIHDTDLLSCDIETSGRQITCIGFAPNEALAIVIPFWADNETGNYWLKQSDEIKVWQTIRRWCGLPDYRIVGQNFLYDMRFLWERYGIPVTSPVEDTMLLHHALQPELQKGLGFLGSIYTDEPSWKFMRKTSTLKREE